MGRNANNWCKFVQNNSNYCPYKNNHCLYICIVIYLKFLPQVLTLVDRVLAKYVAVDSRHHYIRPCCCVFCTKPMIEPVLIWQLALRLITLAKFNKNTNIFIQKICLNMLTEKFGTFCRDPICQRHTFIFIANGNVICSHLETNHQEYSIVLCSLLIKPVAMRQYYWILLSVVTSTCNARVYLIPFEKIP